MAEKTVNLNSSSGSHQRGISAGKGWQEAKAEFYQEAFHLQQNASADSGCAPDVEEASVNNEMMNWETELPSKKAKNIDAKTLGRSTSTRRMSSRTLILRNTGNSPSAADLEMETMPDLAQGFADEEETWNKLQLIRTLPVNMAKKRELKMELMSAPTFRMRGLDLLKFRRRQLWRKLFRSLKQILSALTPWQSSLRAIEANFGTGVASYFMLIRWLLLLNIVIAGFVVVFMIIPWELGKESCPNFTLNDTAEFVEPILEGCSMNSSVCDDQCVSKSDSCWNDYRNSVLITVSNHSLDPFQIIQDLVQGTGWLELSPAFYGFFQPAYVPWGEDKVYNVALGYALTVIFVLLFSLACISKSVASKFRGNIHLGRAYLHQFSDLVFTSWDYCIDSAKMAGIKRKNIANAIRVALEEKAHKEEKSSRTIGLKLRLFLIRVAVNLVVVSTLTLAGCIIYWVTDFSEKSRKLSGHKSGSFDSPQDFGILVFGFLPSIVITALNYFVPILFRILARYERYSATFEIKRTLYRTILLRLSSLLVLVLTLYTSLKSASNFSNCYPKDLSHASMCWESYVGQQLYRLCIFDLALALCRTLILQLPSVLILRRCISPNGRFRCLSHPEFDLVDSTLDLVYGQSICWLGMFYCPILPVAIAIKCIIVFYTKYLSLTVYAAPPSRLYGASSSTSLFMNTMLFSFIFCAIPLGYHFTSLQPSSSCGPYRGLPTVWSAVSKEVALLPETIRNILSFFGTAGFFVPAILFLLVALYYFRSKSAAQRAISESLTQQLVLEAEDKAFLLSRLAAATLVQRKSAPRCPL